LSQRRRFYAALSLLIDSGDWGGLEYVEAAFDRLRGQILAEHVCKLRGRVKCQGLNCECRLCERTFVTAFDEEYHVIE